MTSLHAVAVPIRPQWYEGGAVTDESMQPAAGYLRAVRLLRDSVPDFKTYPFSIPSIQSLEQLELDAKVTFLVGENGAGKSTLIEAIAVLAGFNAEGGSKNFQFGTRRSESSLHQFMRPVRGHRRARDGFFLRAESYFNVATEIERLGGTIINSYGGVSLHEQSHGESLSSPERFFKSLFGRTKGDVDE